MSAVPKWTKGGWVIDPPCEFGHTRQAMECPSCSDRLGRSEPANAEWWAWYRRRYAKKSAPAAPVSGSSGKPGET